LRLRSYSACAYRENDSVWPFVNEQPAVSLHIKLVTPPLGFSLRLCGSLFRYSNLVYHAPHYLARIKRNARLQRSMSSSRENSPDRHIPRGRERGKHRRRRHRTQGSTQQPREETAEDATKDFHGGTANSEGSEEVDRPSRKHHQLPNYPPIRVSNEDDLYLSEPPGRNWTKGLWKHAAKATAPRGDESPEHMAMSLEPTLVMHRRGRRYTSEHFYYERGWTDRQFAETLKHQYTSQRLRDVGLVQKLVAYRQIDPLRQRAAS
jgi:hypothetical protein